MNLLKIFHEKSQQNLVRANSLLLVFLVISLVLITFLPLQIQDILNKTMTTAIFFTSIYALSSRSRILFPIAVLLTLDQWTAKIIGSDLFELIAGFLNTLFFIYVVIRLVVQFAKAKSVSPLVILGSVNGYLLLGLVFSIFTLLVKGIYPESYFLSNENTYLTGTVNFNTYIYYTFITMATVGYGDIVPVSPPARALAVFISVSGQLYIAVLVAFLVGKFAGVHGRTKDEGGET